MGLSPVDYPGACDLAGATYRPRDARELLTELIARYTPGSAVALSTQLLERYGSLSALLTAFRDDAVDTDVPDDIHRYLGALARAFEATLRTSAEEGLQVGSPAALVDLLRHDMVQLDQEVFRVIYLDGCSHVLADRVMWTGTIDGVQVHPREIVRAILDTGATALVLAHNHPSSSAKPSKGDIATTAQILRACISINVSVHDHLIVATDGIFSMRAAGILTRLEKGEAAHRRTGLRECA